MSERTLDVIRNKFESIDLDDIVHDAISQLASDVNNGGMKSQLDFLIEMCCFSPEEILDCLEAKPVDEIISCGSNDEIQAAGEQGHDDSCGCDDYRNPCTRER